MCKLAFLPSPNLNNVIVNSPYTWVFHCNSLFLRNPSCAYEDHLVCADFFSSWCHLDTCTTCGGAWSPPQHLSRVSFVLNKTYLRKWGHHTGKAKHWKGCINCDRRAGKVDRKWKRMIWKGTSTITTTAIKILAAIVDSCLIYCFIAWRERLCELLWSNLPWKFLDLFSYIWICPGIAPDGFVNGSFTEWFILEQLVLCFC